MSKFNRGPWHIERNFEYSNLHCIWNDCNVLIARTCFGTASEANAKLIASAPLLLHELQECLKDFIVQQTNMRTDIKAGNKRWEGAAELLEERIKSIKHAIKQATGE